MDRAALNETLQSIAITAVEAQKKGLSLETIRELLADLRGDLDYADGLVEDEDDES
jgi:hypothetical protein